MGQNSINKKKQALEIMKMKYSRGDIFSDKCPSREVLKVLTSRWGLLVMLALNGEKSLRFSELKKRIQGISEKMLSQTLKSLEGHRLIHRFSHNVVPPVVEYSLTKHGQDFCEKAVELSNWIEENIFDLTL